MAAATTWTDEERRVVLRLLERTDLRCREVAEAVGVSARTVRRWRARARAGQPLSHRVGRRPKPVSRERRQQVIGMLFDLGPYAGVAVLRAACKAVPYRQIARLKRRFLRVLTRRLGWWRKRLEWLRAGAVWAMDFTKPKKATLGGGRGRLLHVRDLASGAELLVLPCRGERSSVVCAALSVLFLALGVPLLIKMDNGPGFKAGATQDLLAERAVTALYSPTYTPSYNGACECGGGSLKRRIAYQAYLRGDPGRWTDADLEAAQRQANTTARPWGATGPTPAERFHARRPIEPEEREAFQETRAAEITNMLETHKEQSSRMPTCSEQAAVLRTTTFCMFLTRTRHPARSRPAEGRRSARRGGSAVPASHAHRFSGIRPARTTALASPSGNLPH